jgi:TolB-like protein
MRLVVLALLVALPAAAGAAGRTRIAVTEVKSVQGVAAGTATILSDIVVSEAARQGFEVISQADISAMIGFEKQKKMLGCEETTSCLAEIGGALGVDFMLTGQVGQIGSRYRISLLVVDTRKARVVARAAQFCDQNEDALARAAETTVGQVLTALRGEIPAPSAAARPSGTTAAPASPPAPKPAPDLAAAPPRPAPAAAATATVSAAAPTSGRHMTTAAWISGSAGAAFLVGGLVTGLAAKKQYDDLQALQASRGYLATFDSKQSTIKSEALAANVMLGLGVAGAGAAGFLWWRSDRDQVAVAPVVGDGSVGLVAAGHF